MKKTILYTLLLSGIIFMIGVYIYKQYQYKKFEDLFMNSAIYGSNKFVVDTTFEINYKKYGYNIKDYKYLFYLKNKNNKTFLREFFLTKSFDNSNGNKKSEGSGHDFYNQIPIFGIKNIIYLKFISDKWVPNKKAAYYVTVEYEKKRRIQYYVEITEKLENNKYTIYFKSYPPKKILNAKNQYIKN